MCEKQFLYLNTDADAEMPRCRCRDFQVASTDCYTFFFQHDSKLNETLKLVTPII